MDVVKLGNSLGEHILSLIVKASATKPSRSSTLHHLVFTTARHTVVELAAGLMHSSQSSDVKMQAMKIYTVLVGLDPQ